MIFLVIKVYIMYQNIKSRLINEEFTLTLVRFYRDFKPQNLLLFSRGQIINIADMGVSRTETLKSMTNMTGTLLYTSPGIMIYEILLILDQHGQS